MATGTDAPATASLEAAREALLERMTSRARGYLELFFGAQHSTEGHDIETEVKSLAEFMIKAALEGAPGTTGMTYSELRLHASKLEREVVRLRERCKNQRRELKRLNAKQRAQTTALEAHELRKMVGDLASGKADESSNGHGEGNGRTVG